MILSRGAEAVIRRNGNEVTKDRVIKSYRHTEIDNTLRKSRTRREAKVIKTLNDMNFPSPKLIASDDKEMNIIMEYIDGEKLRDVLIINHIPYCTAVGSLVAQLHSKNIIHGDLTTSNMLVKDDEIYFIDFGLSMFSTKVEDKAVDIHLLKQALDSAHHTISKECFTAFKEGYLRYYSDASLVLDRFIKVEARGRNKHK